MRRKRVYIAGPITKGDLKHNVDQATAAFVALAKAGIAPLCPHWSVYAKPAEREPGFRRFGGRGGEGEDVPGRVVCEATAAGNPEMSHADWMGVDLPWVAVSDAVLRLPGDSTGADMEVKHAGESGVPVFHSIAGVLAYFGKPDAAPIHGGHDCPGPDMCDCHV